MIENIKHTILDKAIKLFKENGFDNVTINEICECCNITKRTFYYHYDSKKTLLLDYFSLVDEDIETTLKDIDNETKWLDKCWKVKQIHVNGIANLNPDILKNLIKIDMEQQNNMFSFRLNDYDPNLKRLRQMVLEYTRKAQETGEIDADTSAEDLSYCFASAFLGLAVNWSSTGGNFDLVEASKKYFDLIYKKTSIPKH
ncbi:TetR/AcrR family transcriptional regulator [Anaerocolumna sp. MB42-C2]|uniref:TetR/AcrR family transcriptional regulator n=1 Tax=Anaerocolumna sp. MB42-C2 TaxID=3070997 RepID=UPI0027DF6249|nr:TetR/AcrR family transcriptional regulator [Anaerocolumna sp. MB42-C2]WMJ86841.1 TetR/AcrR family transcriptional regulator [Anaerocolumna sp. MB42-C2]